MMDGDLVDLLDTARQRGLVGPVAFDVQLRHALGFARIIEGWAQPPAAALDLGSGGGLPGLVLAVRGARARRSEDGSPNGRTVLGAVQWSLLDGRHRSAAFLREAVERLGLESWVRVVEARAEDWARTEARQSFDVVVARSFGPPAVTAECAAGFLRTGGNLVVSEPPHEPDLGSRWPAGQLGELGFGPSQVVAGEFGYRVLELVRPCPDRFPRRVGLPAKRPLF